MLTKSLRTVTAVTKVAMHLRQSASDMHPIDVHSAAALVSAALDVLGYDGERLIAEGDATIVACVKAVAKAMQS